MEVDNSHDKLFLKRSSFFFFFKEQRFLKEIGSSPINSFILRSNLKSLDKLSSKDKILPEIYNIYIYILSRKLKIIIFYNNEFNITIGDFK